MDLRRREGFCSSSKSPTVRERTQKKKNNDWIVFLFFFDTHVEERPRPDSGGFRGIHNPRSDNLVSRPIRLPLVYQSKQIVVVGNRGMSELRVESLDHSTKDTSRERNAGRGPTRPRVDESYSKKVFSKTKKKTKHFFVIDCVTSWR